MRSIPAPRHPKARGVHPAPPTLANDCGAVAACLLAYMGALALIVMAGATVFDGLEFDLGAEPVAQAG